MQACGLGPAAARCHVPPGCTPGPAAGWALGTPGAAHVPWTLPAKSSQRASFPGAFPSSSVRGAWERQPSRSEPPQRALGTQDSGPHCRARRASVPTWKPGIPEPLVVTFPSRGATGSPTHGASCLSPPGLVLGAREAPAGRVTAHRGAASFLLVLKLRGVALSPVLLAALPNGAGAVRWPMALAVRLAVRHQVSDGACSCGPPQRSLLLEL